MLKSAVMVGPTSVAARPSVAIPQTKPPLTELDLLASLHYLRDFNEERLSEMVPDLKRQSFSPGEVILLEGTPAENLVLVQGGLFRFRSSMRTANDLGSRQETRSERSISITARITTPL